MEKQFTTPSPSSPPLKGGVRGEGAGSLLIFAAIFLALIATLIIAVPGHAADKPSSPPAGLSREEAMRLGQAMYRDGILPSGEHMQAVVEGDIPVDGSMFSCSSCHMRAGLGSVEGTVITPPTNGEVLFRSRKDTQEYKKTRGKNLPAHLQAQDTRPDYTNKTLAEVLQTGIDPSGEKLDPIMPRYLLAGRDMDILVYYLKNLSAEPSPGVTRTTLRFATVVSEGVSKSDRDAMLLPLETYIRGRSSRAPYFETRAASRVYAEEMDLAYRRLSLATWVLKGPPETWRGQLEKYYKKGPVFALLGGIVQGSWLPVHQFCEQNRIPCIFPVTDRPVVSDSDWYTLYFSKGLYQEGEAAARFLKDKNESVVQVFRSTAEGIELSTGFRETRKKLGMPAAGEVALNPHEKIKDSFWKQLSEQYRNAAIILWLGFDEISQFAEVSGDLGSTSVVASSSLLRDDLYHLSENMRPYTFITYPFRLPQERGRIDSVVKSWLKAKKIPGNNFEVSSRMYFLGPLLTNIFMHMQRNFYRDHFLDVIDMLEDETSNIANYPRLSFGPGQRYASKGCYIVQLSPGEKPEIIRKSDWVIH